MVEGEMRCRDCPTLSPGFGEGWEEGIAAGGRHRQSHSPVTTITYILHPLAYSAIVPQGTGRFGVSGHSFCRLFDNPPGPLFTGQ
jgi:hypothetical protein